MKTAALLFSALIAAPAHALDWPFADAPYAYIGVEGQIKASNHGFGIFCANGNIDTANLGLGQVLMRRERFEVVAEWRHHSCVSQYHDRNGYDALGVTLKINFW